MSVTLVVLLAGAVAAVVLAALATTGPTGARPVDPEGAEHWLVAHLAEHSRLRRLLVAAGGRVVGGVAVAAAFGAVWGAGLFVGWMFDTLDTRSGFARWDEAVAEWGSDAATPNSTDVLAAVTRLGETGYLLALLGVVGAVDLVRRRNPDVLLFLASVGVGVSLINNAIKWIVDRDRPVVEHLVGSGGSSFPSGHSAAAAACWAALALVIGRHVGRRFRPLLVGAAASIAIGVAASRALLGVHWLTDVIAGVVVGWTWFFLVALAFGGRLQRLGEPVERAARAAARSGETVPREPRESLRQGDMTR